MASRIVIQHVSAAKANQVEQFPVDAFSELAIGREPSCAIQFDAQRDDYVSRRHAVIRIAAGSQPSFTIADLGSRNGTRLNGETISAEAELLPGDTIELGVGGPKFTFDVQPRPAHLSVRTRALPKAMTDTRILSTAEIEATAKAATTSNLTPLNATSPDLPKSGVGRATVIGMLAAQRTQTNRTWIYVLAAVLVVVAVGGGSLYFDGKLKAEAAATALHEQQRQLVAQREAARRAQAESAAAIEKAQRDNQAAIEKTQREGQIAIEKAQQESAVSLHKAVGVSPQEIVRLYGNSTVLIESSWRLYHQGSGKPVYQKMITQPDRTRLPAYVQLANNVVVRWLTTDDENQTNRVIGLDGLGTGFVISRSGFILTNKHVVAGWTTTIYNQQQRARGEDLKGVLFDIQQRQGPRFFVPAEIPDLTTTWTPLKAAILFQGSQPVPVPEERTRFEGRVDRLQVKFPGSHTPIDARYIRSSLHADVAEIKVDAEQTLTPVELSNGALAPVGEAVTVMGYPAFSNKTFALIRSNEGLSAQQTLENIPEPTVTAGNIARMGDGRTAGDGSQSSGAVATLGSMGELYQLTVPSGAGNSGGPVFDREGKVIGIFSAGLQGRETTTFAVPIKFGLELFKLQRGAE
jgi:S1-C subfamily serine protease